MQQIPPERDEVHAIVSGRVQGVGYRATVRHHASQFGIAGTVRNLPDGTVEVHAQGTPEQLEGFLQALEKDAGFGNVETVEITKRQYHTPFNGFRII